MIGGWLNNCVGGRNYWFFFCTVLSAVLGIILMVLVILYVFIEHFVNPTKLRTAPQFHASAVTHPSDNDTANRKKPCRAVTFDQFKEALGELAKKRFKDKPGEEAVEEIYKLIEGKSPIISGVTKAVASPTVSRLTDTSKFTGSHKERFDESGKGKGKAGREELVDMSGYVPGYKHAGTYAQKVKGSKPI
ncbi:UNVERIFIED_CONTAM: hypothetical protein FKN15_016858 [Acipenser sinensis]